MKITIQTKYGCGAAILSGGSPSTRHQYVMMGEGKSHTFIVDKVNKGMFLRVRGKSDEYKDTLEVPLEKKDILLNF